MLLRSKIMKKITILLFILAFIALAPSQAGAFAGGDGSVGNPYQISTCDHLQAISSDLAASYILISDIDCSDTAEEGFTPIGDSLTPFTGTLDGQGFVISDLFIARNIDRVGLFGQTSADGSIDDVGVENLNIQATSSLGIIVGGLVGLNAGTISSSYTTGDLLIADDFFNSHTLGGLVGSNSGTITDSYSKANVTNNGAPGGGFVGGNSGTITASYAVGVVVSDNPRGGLTAGNSGTITDSFWDTETSGQATSGGGTGKTTAEMKTLSTFTDTDTVGLTTAWDFLGNPNDDEAGEDPWSIDVGVNGGYPF
jgi:hypothetical protein